MPPISEARVKSSLVTEESTNATAATTARGGAYGFYALLQTVVSKFGIMLLNAVTGVLTARMLLPQGRGELAAMTLWPIFLAFVTTLGLPSALIYFLARRSDKRTELIGNGLVMSFAFSTLSSILAALLLPMWLHHQYRAEEIHHAQWFLLLTPVFGVTQAGRAVLEATQNFTASNTLQVLSPITTLVGLLLLLATGHFSVFAAGLCYMAGAVPPAALLIVYLKPLMAQSWKLSLSTGKLLLSYGLRSYGVDLLGALSLQVDQVLVISLLAPRAMGLYGVILSVSRVFNVFQNSIVMVLFPKLTQRSPEEIVPLTAQAARLGNLITIGCAFLCGVAGPSILYLFYGSQYAMASTALRILLLEATLSGCVYILAQGFMASGRPGMIAMLEGTGLLCSVPLMLWLVPVYGLLGAAISLLISTSVRLALVYFGYPVILKVRLPELLPNQCDIRVLLNVLRQLRMGSST
jgi:O-antigen/teichoic acid export membrane protein